MTIIQQADTNIPQPAPQAQVPAPGPPLAFHVEQLGVYSWVQLGDHMVPNLRQFHIRTTYDGASEIQVGGITDRGQLIEFTGYLIPSSDVQLGPAPEIPWDQSTHNSRLFQLHRLVDATGVSGTGIVAEGIQYSDGHVSLRWLGRVKSTVSYDSILDVVAIHGHGGQTQVVWL